MDTEKGERKVGWFPDFNSAFPITKIFFEKNNVRKEGLGLSIYY